MEKIDWFNAVLSHLDGIKTRSFWCDGEQIMYESKSQAEFLADFIETLYKSQGEDIVVVTGYYDKREDERSGTFDGYSGKWYVSVD